jgi:tetratricopeptide (TPR) repeat protein
LLNSEEYCRKQIVLQTLMDAIKFIWKLVGRRLTLELLAVVGVTWIIWYLLQPTTSTLDRLVVTGSLVFSPWYFLLAYWKRIPRIIGILLVILALSGSVAWGLGTWGYLTSTQRQIAGLINLGQEFADEGLYDEAVKRYGQCLTVARKSGDKKAQLECLCSLGENQHLLGEAETARGNLKSCLSLSVELKTPRKQARAMRGLAELERKLGNNDLARRHYADARGLFQKVGNQLGEANVDFAEGVLLGETGRRREAIEMLNRAHRSYAQLGMKDWAQRAKEEAQKLE